MENKGSAWKTVLLVFGIIFSIVLVPGLILGIPAGGVLTSLTSAASQKSIQTMAKEAKLSETLYEMLMDEIVTENQNVEGINQEFWQKLVEESITLDCVDEIVTELIDSAYNGTRPEIKFDKIVEGFRNGLDELQQNGFDDLYSVWADGKESKYFTDEFVQSFRTDVEEGILGNYAEYGATSYEELKTLYEEQNGAGSFSKLIKEYVNEFRDEWDDEFADTYYGELDKMSAELEQEVNESVYNAIQEPDIRNAFDTLKKISEKSSTVKLVVYAILIGAVLLLLVCYWFGTAGFVVPAVALILGGILCKLLVLVEGFIMSQVNKTLAEEPEFAELQNTVSDIAKGILAPIFKGVSNFGWITIGMGVLLILLAILKGVLKKNKAVTE